ncbi:substrate-binding protein of ABC transporter, partial [mine drainage metagenome]
MRVVSVLPSATEIVFALGRGHELVGRSAECDYPAEVRSRPVVMHPRTLDSLAASGEIDARVTAARARGESLYRLDVDRLRELRPDLLLTQDLCGVCSVTGDEVERACRDAGVHPAIVSLTPRRLEEVWASVET